jgi:hypothetical protein
VENRIKPEEIVGLYQKHGLKAGTCHFNVERNSCCGLGVLMLERGIDGKEAQASTYAWTAEKLALPQGYVVQFVKAFDMKIPWLLPPDASPDEIAGREDGAAVRDAVTAANLWLNPQWEE